MNIPKIREAASGFIFDTEGLLRIASAEGGTHHAPHEKEADVARG
jgi:hypothetical protein